MSHAWLVVLGGVVIAPLVTWFPMLSARFPWMGLPQYPAAPGIDLWHLQAFWLISLGALGVIVGQRDRWLGLMLGVVGLTIFLRGAALDPTHSVLFAFGALALVCVRRMPARMWRLVRVMLIGLALFQIAYLLQQYLGYDILWGPLLGGTLLDKLQPVGTLGGVDASAAYVAILLPLLPLWALPIGAFVVWKSQSLGAIIAAGIGLLVCFRVWRHWRFAALALVVILGVVWISVPYRIIGKETQKARVGIWTFAAKDWVRTDPVLGYGLGGWAQRVPMRQIEKKYAPTNELFREAHNEPLQWLIETGLVGLLLFGAWLWEHRRMFAHPIWGASLAACASACLTWHPFHIVSSALVGILLIGLATRDHEEVAACAAC